MSRLPPLALHADLLRALALAGDDADMADRLAGRLGFQRQPDRPLPVAAPPVSPPVEAGPGSGTVPPVIPQASAPSVPAGAPLSAALVAITHLHTVPDDTPAACPAVPALTEADCQPRDAGPPPAATPLLPASALWPALRRSVSHTHAAGIDVPALVRALSRAEGLTRLPLRQRRGAAGHLWVLQDVSDRLQPYQADFDTVVDQLLRLRGDQGMVLWTFRVLPRHTLERVDSRGASDWDGALPAPPAGQRLLLLSDLGALAPGRALERAWADQLGRWRRAGAEVAVWSPTTPRQVPAALAGAAAVQCLSGRAGLRRQRGAWSADAPRAAEHQRLQALLQRLQVLASVAVELQPEVLRELRLLLPELAAEPALEALHWQSPAAAPSLAGRALQPEAAAWARAQFSALPPAVQVAVLGVLQRHHAHSGRSTEATEAQLWHTHASEAARQHPAVAEALQRSALWWQQLQALLPNLGSVRPAMRSFARDLLSRQAADTPWQRQCGEQAAALIACAGDDQAPLPQVPAHLVLQARRQVQPARGGQRWRLLQRGEAVWAWPADQPLPERSSPLDEQVFYGEAVVVRRPGQGGAVRALPEGGGPVLQVAQLEQAVDLCFENATATVACVPRPAWALEQGRGPDGLYTLAPTPWGQPVRLLVLFQQGERHDVGPDIGRGPDDAAGQFQSGSAGGAAAGARTVRVAVLAHPDDRAWHDALVAEVRLMTQGTPVELLDMAVTDNTIDEAIQGLRWLTVDVVVVVLSQALATSEAFLRRQWPAALQALKSRRALLVSLPLDAVDEEALQSAAPGLLMRSTAGSHRPLAGGRLDPSQLRSMAGRVESAVWQVLDRWSSQSAAPGKPVRAVLQVGAEPKFGLYAELELQGEVQRFRWIPPGTFTMGSTAEERARIGDQDHERLAGMESPAHSVRISQGFWLADTACTQALWWALMGDKPSHFTSKAQRPVDNVSHNDVQRFLKRLQPLLPTGCQAVLPTEAQWEYACRAGTKTAFNTGDRIDRQHANFNASAVSALALPGEASYGTVPQKVLPANAWGLHEMHGNVWEWCADGFRNYEETAQQNVAIEDPEGLARPEHDAPRALRGGAFYSPAGSLRSAFRRIEERGYRDDDQGFRLALRSTSVVAPGAARRDTGQPISPRDSLRDTVLPAKPPAQPSTRKKLPRR